MAKRFKLVSSGTVDTNGTTIETLLRENPHGVLTIVSDTSIPTGVTFTVQFSADGVTFFDLLDSSGSTVVLDISIGGVNVTLGASMWVRIDPAGQDSSYTGNIFIG